MSRMGGGFKLRERKTRFSQKYSVSGDAGLWETGADNEVLHCSPQNTLN